MHLLKSLVVQTQSGSQYEILRENGSENSIFLVKKIGEHKNFYPLVFVGNLRELKPGPLGGGVPALGNLIFSNIIGELPITLDKNYKIILDQQLFYYDCDLKTLKDIQRIILIATESQVRKKNSSPISKELVDNLSNSTKIVKILNVSFF